MDTTWWPPVPHWVLMARQRAPLEPRWAHTGQRSSVGPQQGPTMATTFQTVENCDRRRSTWQPCVSVLALTATVLMCLNLLLSRFQEAPPKWPSLMQGCLFNNMFRDTVLDAVQHRNEKRLFLRFTVRHPVDCGPKVVFSQTQF